MLKFVVLYHQVICLYSAWQYYELTTLISSEYFAAIPSKIKRILPQLPSCEAYVLGNNKLAGTNILELNGEFILIYDIEKSV